MPIAGEQSSTSMLNNCKCLKPSYFNSNNQSGWSNAAPRFSSGIGWNRGNTVATRIAGTHLNQCAVPCFSCRNKDESVGLSEK
jgi:hypothetical protein